MKQRIIIIIVILFLLGGLILTKLNINKNVLSDESKPLSYKIIDETEVCADALESIYEDNNYTYYLSCIKSNNIFIEFSNGTKYSLKFVLDNNLISIDELIDKGLKVIKIDKNATNDEFINSDEDINKEDVILTKEEIKKYNTLIKEKATMVYDMDINKITKEEILNYINSYSLNLPKYNGSYTYTNENTKDILNNRNIDNVKDLDKAQKGIVVKRANLRSFPTDKAFYNKKNVTDHDRLQETELLVNTPVLIIHESKDSLWYFVITPFYVGWVHKDNIALANDSDYEFFINNDNFGIITDAMVYENDTILDMSVKLPYLNNDNYIIPIKGKDDYVLKKEITITSDKINKGYLTYTKENLYTQAKKYLGVNYSWGGKDKGVDCSSYVSNIYRVFGFYFPRNTSVQNTSVGKIIDLTNKSMQEKLKLIEENEPALLYQDGHVMLYIGKENNEHYIIHANGSTMNVAITKLDNSSYLNKINKLVLIK